MKRVLVIDACQRSALAVTRSLGSKGVAVFTADETITALAGESRYSSGYDVYPSPRLVPEAFIASLAQLCKRQRIDIIMPMTELTTTLLLAHRHALDAVTLPLAPATTIEQLANKCELMQLAAALDIPIPASQTIDPPSQPVATIDLDHAAYPLVLKPGKSWLEHAGEWLHTSVRFAADASEAATILQSDAAFATQPYLLQQCIPGNGAGIFAIYAHGNPLAFLAHRRLREKPPRGGVSVLSESIAIDPVQLDYAQRLLDHVGWHGVAMVEFRVSDAGTPYLMEINTRFWGSLQLAIDAGVDFPWLLYQLACGESIDQCVHYRQGQRLRWLLGDVDHLYLTLRDAKFSVAHKLRALLGFFTPHLSHTRHEVNRLGDMQPFWWECRRYLAALRGR
jgi:predicted ATP-grasp superfamily ATP-dependent carboligase